MSIGPDPSEIRTLSSQEREFQYRPVSTMAVVSIVLALLSIFAFASPYLWIVPAVALAFATWTTRRLRVAQREYAGGFIANVAVVLSLACGIGAVTRDTVQRFIITRAAHEFADKYLDRILLNKINEAFAMKLSPYVRGDAADDEIVDLIKRAGADYRKFVNDDAIVRLFAGRRDDTQVTFLKTDNYGYEKGFFRVTVAYRFTVGDDLRYNVGVVAYGGTEPNGEWEGRQWYIRFSGASLVKEDKSD